jgi:glycosyltransferase involved in cell wall biosynthesis
MGPRVNQVQRREVAQLENVVFAESDYRLEWMANGGADVVASRRWLLGLIERHGVDVVHINGYAHADLGVDFPVFVVAHSDVLSWWEAVHKRAAPPEWDGYHKRVVAGLAAAARIVAPTSAVLRDIERHYSRLTGNAEVIPNGIDCAVLSALKKMPVVLAAGRIWDAAKNLAALEAVTSRLAWPVEIAGDVEHPESGSSGFANVRVLGRLSPVVLAEHLGRASIFAAPARYEPFGLAILEAAAAGCALVLGDIPSLRENWDGAATFVDPEDRSALQCSISQLIADVDERIRLASAARRRAGRFTLHQMARAYAAVYHDLAWNSPRLEIP